MSFTYYNIARRHRLELEKFRASLEDVTSEEADTLCTMYRENQIWQFKQDVMHANELKRIADELADKPKKLDKQQYFVTIRPDDKLTTFDEFKKDVETYVDRQCITTAEYVFEQKGTDENTLGQGFHAHLIVDATQKSKGQLARDTHSTFKKHTAENCIEVKPIRTAQDKSNVRRYIHTHTSKDGHKEETTIWDAKWRQQKDLRNYYIKNVDDLETWLTENSAPPIKSEGGEQNIDVLEHDGANALASAEGAGSPR